MFRGDIVEDDSRNYAVFTEQRASASYMTAAQVLDVISRVPVCSGQASDAVSAYTQVEMKDAPEPLHLSEEGYPKIWIRSPKARPPSWDSIDDPVVPLERNLFGHPLAGERKLEKVQIEDAVLMAWLSNALRQLDKKERSSSLRWAAPSLEPGRRVSSSPRSILGRRAGRLPSCGR